MAKRNTVSKVTDITRYVGEAAVYEFSKVYKKDTTHVLVIKSKPISGGPRLIIWASDPDGLVTNPKPIAEFGNVSVSDAFNKLGYQLQ